MGLSWSVRDQRPLSYAALECGSSHTAAGREGNPRKIVKRSWRLIGPVAGISHAGKRKTGDLV
jgi:hypothetical protein